MAGAVAATTLDKARAAGAGVDAAVGGPESALDGMGAMLGAWAGPRGEAPVFCMETALKGAYWSIVAYRYWRDTPDPLYTLEQAMAFDGLTQSKAVHHDASDTRGLAAWRTGMLLLAFRGTVSATNAKTDAKAMQTRHPRTHTLGRLLPACVHQGFIAAWETVRSQVEDIVRTAPVDPIDGSLHVFITGHSLGGALATLAAFDVQQLLTQLQPAEKFSITCYTYGAPRVGNHKFAALYKQAVPDTWDVANDQDVVPKSSKWMRIYKRTGERVIISKHGDILVRPSFIEMTIKNKLGGSAADHMMGSYMRSFGAILWAQLDPYKCLEGGAQGVQRLAADRHAGFMLRKCLDVDLYQDPEGEEDEAGRPRGAGLEDVAEHAGGEGGQVTAATSSS